MTKPLLKVENLTTEFKINKKYYPVVDDVSFELFEGETVCIVGESGCGKSMTALSVMGLIPSPPGRISKGKITLGSQDLLKNPKELLKIRGNEISMIFQEPMTSLNPVFTIGQQISEVLLIHKSMTKKQAMNKSIDLLKQVGISDPAKRVHEYPYQLSGGMRQRVMIAIALACDPKLLIADEPTTALDVTIQAQILDLMKDLKSSKGTSIIFITHDLGVVADMADRVVVMYAGNIIEVGEVSDIFERPRHPYMEGLLKSLPSLDDNKKSLSIIEGSIPPTDDSPKGCKFSSRCPFATEKCFQERPKLEDVGNGHLAACWYAEELNLKGVEMSD